jgi:hypothetical protein
VDDEAFDGVARSLAGGASRRRLVGGVLGALGLGAAGRAGAGAAGARKVTVCRDGATKQVSATAWRRLRAAGAATRGACGTPPPPPDPKACLKKHQACDGVGLVCCDHDPGTGEALTCDATKKHRVCVAEPPLGGRTCEFRDTHLLDPVRATTGFGTAQVEVCQTAPDGGGDCRIGGLFTLRGAARNTDFDVYVGPDLVGTITTNASGIGALPGPISTRSTAGLCPTLVNVVVALRGLPNDPGSSQYFAAVATCRVAGDCF